MITISLDSLSTILEVSLGAENLYHATGNTISEVDTGALTEKIIEALTAQAKFDNPEETS